MATEMGIARSTLRDWCGEVPRGDPPTGLTAFARTPEGIDWLHRLVLAAHFSITLRAAGGTRLVSEFLELSGLSAFVGVSDGAQHALNVALETAVVAVAAQQRTALAEGMPARAVTVCEDETFHPGICLVNIEPVSNFIVAGAIRRGSHRGDLDGGASGRLHGACRGGDPEHRRRGQGAASACRGGLRCAPLPGPLSRPTRGLQSHVLGVGARSAPG
ncbi:hypothetical protein [Thiocapsa sp.]|uniref:hypothetical protein n=1 Tax=Thiocapsa sp. TaxID=2024551 RepID=UPI002607CE06|nr:hypothetical protein [Thiocapsa sp.]